MSGIIIKIFFPIFHGNSETSFIYLDSCIYLMEISYIALPLIELHDFSSNHHGGATHIIHKAVYSGSFRNRVRVLGKKYGACACKGQGQSPWKICSEVVGRGPKFGVGCSRDLHRNFDRATRHVQRCVGGSHWPTSRQRTPAQLSLFDINTLLLRTINDIRLHPTKTAMYFQATTFSPFPIYDISIRNCFLTTVTNTQSLLLTFNF